MSDNVQANAGSGGAIFKTDEVGGVHTPITKVAFGVDGTVTTVDVSNPLPVVSYGEMSLDAATLSALETVQVGNFPATQPVSATSLPLPAGAATETTLSDLNTKTPAVGQATMAASRPVVLASNQSAIPVTGTFWQATQPISDTVTANTGLSQPVTDTQLRASDVKVSLDGEVVPITAMSLPLPLGAATELTSSSSDQLLDEIVFILQSMLEKMPRVTGNDQASVSVEAGSLSTVSTVTTCGTVTTVSQLGTRAAMTAADAMIMQGTSHIYNNLVVS